MNKQKSRILAHSHPAIERLLRHRWLTLGVGGSALLGMVAAFALAPSGERDTIELQTVLEQLSPPSATLIGFEVSSRDEDQALAAGRFTAERLRAELRHGERVLGPGPPSAGAGAGRGVGAASAGAADVGLTATSGVAAGRR